MGTTYDQNTRKSLVDFMVITLCMIGIFLAFELRNFVYFRDYSITFEGAYRLFLGQVPFRDFGTPVGPVSFLIPALFFKLFNPNWTVFLFAQQFQNACQLILVYALLRRIGIRPLIRRIALVVFSTFYLLLLTHPWYNSTGFLLMLAVALCALGSSRISVMATGLLVGLTVLTKQDFGLFALCIGGVIVAMVSLGSDREKILPDPDSISDKTRLMALAINLLLLVISAVAVVATFIQATDAEQFKYWFNYGQAPHQHRSISLSSFGVLGWVTLLIAVACNNFRLLVASLFITAASLTKSTSGLYFTHNYFVVFLPIVVDECLRIKSRFKLLTPFVLLVLLYTAARPVRDSYFVLESVAKEKPEHYFFNYRKISRPTTSFPKELKAFSHHTKTPQQTIDAIQELQQIATNIRATRDRNFDLKVLNLTELTPIYAELGVAPPLKVPLWFHSNVSLFPQQINQIDKLLSGRDYDIILLQGTHEGLTNTYKNFLSILNANSSYRLSRKIQDSPSNATEPRESDYQADIFIYIKSDRSAQIPLHRVGD